MIWKIGYFDLSNNEDIFNEESFGPFDDFCPGSLYCYEYFTK
jgi:hypothetical protein